MASVKKVFLQFYRWEGKFLFIKIKTRCKECDLSYVAINRLMEQVFNGKPVTLDILPWLDNLWKIILIKEAHEVIAFNRTLSKIDEFRKEGMKEVFERIEPLFKSLAPKDGYLHCGQVGSGHYVKMVHNGIEYGMMEAIGEGFEILKASPQGIDLNLGDIANLWNQGSVIRSWLMELLADAFKKDPELSGIQGYVEDSGEGR